MTLLTLENVTKRFGPVTAVADVSCTIDRGQVVGFLGPNGAGKSTTMRMINQAIEPDEGAITFDGTPLADASRDIKRRIGYLPENNPLYSEMLVGEYLDFMADLRDIAGRPRATAIDDAVAATGLATVFYRPIGELSKGFRQRVGLAQAILPRPDLLILDEPTEGLDPNQRVEIRHLIERLGEDRTVVLSTHVLSEVKHTCSRLLVIHQGRLAADGPVEELVSRASGAVVIRVEARGTGVVDALGSLEGVTAVDENHHVAGGRVAVSLTARADPDLRPVIFDLAKAKGWTLYELHHDTRSLEHLFQELTTAEPQ